MSFASQSSPNRAEIIERLNEIQAELDKIAPYTAGPDKKKKRLVTSGMNKRVITLQAERDRLLDQLLEMGSGVGA